MPACHPRSRVLRPQSGISNSNCQHHFAWGDGGGAENRPQYSPPARPLVEVAANRKEGIEGNRVRRYEET